jgi:hypothetical protein
MPWPSTVRDLPCSTFLLQARRGPRLAGGNRLIKIKSAADPLSTIRSNWPVAAEHQKAAVEISW